MGGRAERTGEATAGAVPGGVPARDGADRGAAPDAPAAASTVVGITVASCGLVLAALPVFLVGGLAVQIREELGFSETALGAAVAGAFLTGALGAPVAGRLADRIGARASVLTGSALAALALAGIAGLANGWSHLAALLVLSGLGLAIIDPGIAILLTRAVPSDRQGVAFGVKEASIPIATLTAGLAVPAIALTLGWRWAFLVGALPLAGILVLLPRLPLGARDAVLTERAAVAGPPEAGEPPAEAPPADALPADAPPGEAPAADDAPPGEAPAAGPSRGTLVLVSAATALGLGAASGVGVFLTQSAVAMGLSPGSAGLLLAVGSVAGIVTRIVAGLVADRRAGAQFGLISWMLVAGAAGMALGAAGAGPLLVVGTIAAFSGGWGWSGLLFLSLVRASPGAPGAAAGIGVAGLATGNALGPLLFGAASQALSFAAAWAAAAAAVALAALLMRSARSRFRAESVT